MRNRAKNGSKSLSLAGVPTLGRFSSDALEGFEVTSGNIFEDLGLDEAEDLTVRSDLLSEINQIIRNSKLKQKEIAHLLQISPPKVSMLLNGRLSAFSTDTLIKYLSLLGRSIEICVKGSSLLTPNVRKGCITVKGKRHVASNRRKRLAGKKSRGKMQRS